MDPSKQITARVDVIKLAQVQRYFESLGHYKRTDAHLVQMAVEELWKTLVRAKAIEYMDIAEAYRVLNGPPETEGLDPSLLTGADAKRWVDLFDEEEGGEEDAP